MEKMYKEYKENIKYFLTKKSYIITIILIAILCYGFYITNYSIGVDDLSQDRYIGDTYLLSQSRWGNFLFARIFNITNFVPFWTEFISVLLLISIAVMLSAFLKKQIGNIVDKTIYYVIFSGIFISYPVIHHIFLYNFANVIAGVTTLAMIVIGIIIYENTINIKNRKIYYVLVAILPFIISMYEAGCQVFLVFTLAVFFIDIIKNKKVQKTSFKYIINSILVLGIAIILNYMIAEIIKAILSCTGTLTKDYSTRSIPWLKYDLNTCLKSFNQNIIQKLLNEIVTIEYIGAFFALALITLIISIIQSIKNKNAIYVFTSLGIILSNFVLSVIQARIIYRTNISWSLTMAFMVLYILIFFKNYKVMQNVLIVLASFIIIYNSKDLTFLFYNDHVRYEREKNIACDIANTIIRTCDNLNKPIVYIPYSVKDVQGNAINLDNGWSAITWGIAAFGERGTETTKFINSFGYNFNTPTVEEWNEAYKEFQLVKEQYKDEYVIELDKYIIVKIIIEPRVM